MVDQVVSPPTAPLAARRPFGRVAGRPDSAPDTAPEPTPERVVLLDTLGRPTGTAAKATVHHTDTPFHLGFSCHVVAPGGRVLLTRRAATKRTWPATWSNACCGHPAPGETLRAAVERRLADELGLVATRMALASPDFAYRAVMDDGTVEHELCPVVVAEVGREPRPARDEVDGVEWVAWDELVRRAEDDPESLSPWSVAQVRLLAGLAPSPGAWLDAHTRAGRPTAADTALDRLVDGSVRNGPVRNGSVGNGSAALAPSAVAVNGIDDPIEAVRGPVDRILAAFLAAREREVADIDPAAAGVAAEVGRLVAAGGKRLRPAFATWAHRAVADRPDERVLTAVAALELLHTFALLHDDVMDRSAVRRGRPTAHRALAEQHRSEGLDGDGDWYGVSAAVLAGDLAFLWSTQLIGEAGLSAVASGRARRVFARLCTEVIAGQVLDLRLAAGDGARPAGAAEALAQRVALLKSARYTVTRPLEFGLALAGTDPDPDLARALATYGDAIGLAFQLRDDVLGLFGDPQATGKSRLDDLREGKRTLLVVRALDLADRDGVRVVREALGDPLVDEVRAERCREVVASSGALASVEALIAARCDEALAALDVVPQPARSALERLAALTAHRQR